MTTEIIVDNIIRFPNIKSPRTIEDLAHNANGLHCAALIYYDSNGGIHFQTTPIMTWEKLIKACSYIEYVGNANQDRDQNPRGPGRAG